MTNRVNKSQSGKLVSPFIIIYLIGKLAGERWIFMNMCKVDKRRGWYRDFQRISFNWNVIRGVNFIVFYRRLYFPLQFYFRLIRSAELKLSYFQRLNRASRIDSLIYVWCVNDWISNERDVLTYFKHLS